MARAGFYNDNEYRQYPLVFKSTYAGPDLPTELIVDCGFVMGLDSDFDADTHIVYLAAIRRFASSVEFEFRSTASKIANIPLIFNFSTTSEDWTEIQIESPPVTAGTFCAVEPAWSGYMAIGRLADFLAVTPAGSTFNYMVAGQHERTVEPNRIQSLVKAYLRAINVGNYERRVIQPCSEGGSSSSPSIIAPVRDIIVNATCINGDVVFQPGFNCEITQVNNLREITIAPAIGANTRGIGAEEFCQNGSEIKLSPTEQPPTGSQFLSGGPACDEVITGINGLQAADIKIVGGSGIQVVADPVNNHTIQIKHIENLLSQNC